MDFIEQLNIWAKGDALQGRWMVGIALTILVPISLLILMDNNLLIRGMLIPACLLSAMNIVYGGYLLLIKLKHVEKTEIEFRLDPVQILKNEAVKIEADHKSYSLTKPVWAICIVISSILYFFFEKEYCRGLALGLIGMFFGMLVVDTFLHSRLIHYDKATQNTLNLQ